MLVAHCLVGLQQLSESVAAGAHSTQPQTSRTHSTVSREPQQNPERIIVPHTHCNGDGRSSNAPQIFAI